MPTAEIIAAGTELTSGQKLDTNSQWLASHLRDIGIEPRFHTTVGDALEDNVLAIRNACERCDVVLITGGLGPTLDDITRDAIAAVLDEQLVIDNDALSRLEELFRSRGRSMPERNRSQAMRPRSAQLLANPHGTAPGVLANSRGGSAVIAAMPGVPSEMRPMFLNEVCPHLPSSSDVNVLKLVHCYGLGESDVEQRLGDMTARGRNPEVGITASAATISLRVLAKANSKEEAELLASRDVESIQATLGQTVFGRGDDTLQSVVVEQLRSGRKSVATAESGSGGALLSLLASAENYTEIYAGGFTVPPAGDDEILGEPAPTDPFSKNRAEHLASEVRRRLHADFGLAAICDPVHFGTAAASEDASAYVALASDRGVESKRLSLYINRALHSPRIAKTALDLLRLHLLSEG